MKRILTVILLACTTACAPTQEEVLKSQRAYCEGAGFEGEKLSDCMMQLEMARQEQETSRKAAVASALQNMKLQPVQQPYMMQPIQRNSFSCTSNSMGNTLYTNCR